MSPEVLTHRISNEVLKAVIGCPNEISPETIVLKVDGKQNGVSAMTQLSKRISDAVTRLAEDGKIQLGP
jgi:hypothetical protein